VRVIKLHFAAIDYTTPSKHKTQFSILHSFDLFLFHCLFVHSIYCTHTQSQSQSITAILGGLCSGRRRRGRGRGPPVIALQLKEEKNKRGAKYKKGKKEERIYSLSLFRR